MSAEADGTIYWEDVETAMTDVLRRATSLADTEIQHCAEAIHDLLYGVTPKMFDWAPVDEFEALL